VRSLPRIARWTVLLGMAAVFTEGGGPSRVRASESPRVPEVPVFNRDERTFSFAPSLRVTTPGARFSFEGPGGVGFDLDAATLGAFALSDVHARLKIRTSEPTDRIDEWISSLRLSSDAAGADIRVVDSGGTVLAALRTPRNDRPVRVSLMILDRVVLHILPADGSDGVSVWQGRLSYRMRFPETDQYLLCGRLSATIGGRSLAANEIFQGIGLHRLDDAGTVRIRGIAPLGHPFDHVYDVNPVALEQRVDRAIGHLIRTLQGRPEDPVGGPHAIP